jgi:phage terminase large subunit-like protein
MAAGLALVHPPPRPRVRPPADRRWREWFSREVAPLHTPAIDTSPDYRRRVTRGSLLRFMYVYLPHHLKMQGSSPPVCSFNPMQLAFCRAAKQWIMPVGWREAWIAPRGAGKSTYAFLGAPLWALAHGHRSYFMAFSHTNDMALDQLANLRAELADNDLLLEDFPHLRTARRRGASDTKRLVVRGGGTIAAAGLGSNTVGKKSGADRPDLIVCDDIEPLEEMLPEKEKAKIELAIKAAVIGMAASYAAIMVMGTTTGYDSVVHRIAEHGRGRKHVDWVANQQFTVRLFPAIQIDPDTGEEFSLWPERWALTDTHLGEHLRRNARGETPREFQLNYLLDPSPYGEDAGSFWRDDMFVRRTSASFGGVWEHCLFVDGANTKKATSDRTAMVIVGRDPARQHAVIEYAAAFRISAEDLRKRIHRLAARKPTLRTVIVEVNNGGDLWEEMLDPPHDPLPRQLRLITDWASVSKELRVEQALQWYETDRVFHAKEFVELEREMVMFPNPKINDDLVDALTGALRWALAKKKS